jgi:hypothetical protein
MSLKDMMKAAARNLSPICQHTHTHTHTRSVPHIIQIHAHTCTRSFDVKGPESLFMSATHTYHMYIYVYIYTYIHTKIHMIQMHLQF